MLSFLDVSILLEDHKFSFVLEQINNINLLNRLMLCSNNVINNKAFFEGLIKDLQPLLKNNLSDNPWFSMYLTSFEKTNYHSTSMCILSTKVVQSIMKRHFVGTMPIDDEDPNANIKSLSLSLNVSKKEPSNLNKKYFFVSNLMNHINLKTKHLYVCPYRLRTV